MEEQGSEDSKKLVYDEGKRLTQKQVKKAKTNVSNGHPCQNCKQHDTTEVLFHSNVSQFDELVKMIAIVGEKFETYNNISVLVHGEPIHSPSTKQKSDNSTDEGSKTKTEKEDRFEMDELEDSNVNTEGDDNMNADEEQENTKEGKSTTKKKTYCCDECGKTFKERSSLWRHRKITHEKVAKYMNRSKQVKDHTCPVCQETLYDTYQRFFLHKQKCEAKATGVNPYICSICGRSFPTTNQHGNHFTSCSGKGKKYYNTKACTHDNCDYKTGNSTELDNHIRRTHLNMPITKNHICTLCGNAYNKVAILNQHIKSVHLNEKPHTCPTCGRSFARKQKMKEHMKLHTGEANFTCPLCHKTFNNRDSQWSHKKSCPGEREASSVATIVQPFSISIV